MGPSLAFQKRAHLGWIGPCVDGRQVHLHVEHALDCLICTSYGPDETTFSRSTDRREWAAATRQLLSGRPSRSYRRLCVVCHSESRGCLSVVMARRFCSGGNRAGGGRRASSV